MQINKAIFIITIACTFHAFGMDDQQSHVPEKSLVSHYQDVCEIRGLQISQDKKYRDLRIHVNALYLCIRNQLIRKQFASDYDEITNIFGYFGGREACEKGLYEDRGWSIVRKWHMDFQIIKEIHLIRVCGDAQAQKKLNALPWREKFMKSYKEEIQKNGIKVVD